MSTTRETTENLARWDSQDDPLAPLTERQRIALLNLQESVNSLDLVSLKDSNDLLDHQEEKSICTSQIDSYQDLMQAYTALEESYMSDEDSRYLSYLNELKSRRAECSELCTEIEGALKDFSLLSKQYATVSSKTTSLHSASEQLITDQRKLNSFVEEISDRVKYFIAVNSIMEKLNAPTLSVNSEMFFDLLSKIDGNIEFMLQHSTYKESSAYIVKYRVCQSKAMSLVQNYLSNMFNKAADSILNPKEGVGTTENAEAALALFYGRFQTILAKVRPVIEQIESRVQNRTEYEGLLSECHQHYLSKRGVVLGPSVEKALESVKERYNGDHCSLVRHSCAVLLHASVDEHRLFYQFFARPSAALNAYLEDLCTSLYDTLRPFIIHINHLETLAEICCILRVEMLDEHVQNNSEPLQGFGNVCLQLLHDVQERLVFRAHLYLQSDILNYNPSPGDLAYPEKLKMMEEIAESIREENRQNKLKRISISSGEAPTLEMISRSHLTMDPMHHKTELGNSPADLHGMWYPTVRRTLVCLSRLYRCVDRPVFQSLSQEAITYCVQSIEIAKDKIKERSTDLDAELFQVKHLLILREQIAPFQVDFTVKEYSLDFSKVKIAAFGLLEKRSRLFALSNNALLEFLLEGAPQMKEQLIDSRKHVDAKLKSTCQQLIQHSTCLLIDPIVKLLERWTSHQNAVHGSANPAEITSETARERLGTPQDIAAIVGEALRLIKFKLPSIQQSMQLYLANKETECILFRPIKNNIVAAFTQLLQLLSNYYSPEELLLIACPMPEQISVMLSSTRLLQQRVQRSQSEIHGERTPDDSQTEKINATEYLRKVSLQSNPPAMDGNKANEHANEIVTVDSKTEVKSLAVNENVAADKESKINIV